MEKRIYEGGISRQAEPHMFSKKRCIKSTKMLRVGNYFFSCRQIIIRRKAYGGEKYGKGYKRI